MPASPKSGSGIGLTIVRDILRLHGCTVDVESEEGRGTRFTFTLPLGGGDVSAAPAGPSDTDPSALPEQRRAAPETRPATPAAGPEPDDVTPPADDPVSSPDEPRPRLRIIRRHKP